MTGLHPVMRSDAVTVIERIAPQGDGGPPVVLRGAADALGSVRSDLLVALRDHPRHLRHVRAFAGGEARDLPYDVRSGRPDVDAIVRLLDAGGTLRFTEVQEMSPVAATWSSLWHERFGGQPSVAAFWSGPGASDIGLPVHWDDVDVLVVQFEGRKRWLLGPPSDLRSGRLGYDASVQVDPSRMVLGGSAQEVTLCCGDVLYVPRGRWHAAVGCDEGSMHLAVGATGTVRAEALRWVLSMI